MGYDFAMDATQLKYFLAVARLEHVTNAAKSLNISQPALTRALHRLEESLGVKLFVHEGRNVRLTREGAYLRDRVAPALADLEGAEAALRSFSQQERDTVNLCIRSASVLAIDSVARFAKERPQVRFCVTQDDGATENDVVVETLSVGSIVRRGNGKTDGKTHCTFTERIGVMLPESSALLQGAVGRRRKTVGLDELSQERFIALAGSRGFRPLCDALCVRHGFVPDVSFESDNPSVVRKTIALGLGVGFWPEHSWGAIDAHDGVRWLPLRQSDFRRQVALSLTPLGMEKESARAFLEVMAQTFRAAWETE